MDKLIRGALEKKGFSLVEVISNCHTYFGRLNREGDAVKMLDWMKKHAMPIQAARKLPPEKMEGKFVTGLLHDEEKEEYCEKYARLVNELQSKSGAR
jgi:2-oxoglutarate ferredoxin oxidoreductase subunit beta